MLADATREQPFWRPVFGHPLQRHHDAGPDCVLEAARSLLASQDLIKEDSLLRPILRLIANCCADDNVSRSVLVNRGGVDCMKELAVQNRALDLLLPTLYNVCVDYEEVAVDENGQPLRLKDLDTSVELTKAEQALGSCLRLKPKPITAVELFLNLTASSDEGSFGFLADLAEMASRPALFGIQHIFSKDDSSWPDQSHRLLKSLLTRGIVLMEQDEETLQPVLQTILNVLSQKQIQVALVQSSEQLLASVKLLGLETEVPSDLKRYWESLIQLVYTVSSLPEFAEAYDPASEPFSHLVRQLEQLDLTAEPKSPFLWASLTILLANALTDPARITRCLSRFPTMPENVAKVLHSASAPVVTVPALDLAGRLALDPAGQSAFLSTNIHETLNQKLQPPTTPPERSKKSHTFTIQRETIALTRLLLKAPPPSQQTPPSPTQLTPTQPLHNTILALFTTTLDTSTKLEIGRYAVEVLRNLPNTPTVTDTTTPAPQLPIAPLLQPLLHLTTQSQTPASRAEGVFGLGLLLSRTAPSTIPDLIPSTVEQGGGAALLGALGQVFDAAGVATAEDGGTRTEGRMMTRRVAAEAENARLVVVRLLGAVGRGRGGERVVEIGDGEMREGTGAMAVAEEEEDGVGSKRAEFVSALEELAGRMGVRGVDGG